MGLNLETLAPFSPGSGPWCAQGWGSRGQPGWGRVSEGRSARPSPSRSHPRPVLPAPALLWRSGVSPEGTLEEVAQPGPCPRLHSALLLIKPANGFLLMRKARLIMTNRWEQRAKRRHVPDWLPLGGAAAPPTPAPGSPNLALRGCAWGGGGVRGARAAGEGARLGAAPGGLGGPPPPLRNLTLCPKPSLKLSVPTSLAPPVPSAPNTPSCYSQHPGPPRTHTFPPQHREH